MIVKGQNAMRHLLGLVAAPAANIRNGHQSGKTPDQNHMANWIECVRSRKTPNAPVEIGYRSAIAVHMANLAYRRKQRVTLEMAKSMAPEF